MAYRISDRIKEISTVAHANRCSQAADKRAFCIHAMGISAEHPRADYWVDILQTAFAGILGESFTSTFPQAKGTSTAQYKLRQCNVTGVYVAETTVKWSRKYGKCDRREHSKHNTVYTRSALTQWGARNGVTVETDDLELMPVTE